jgi:hypothetical protein
MADYDPEDLQIPRELPICVKIVVGWANLCLSRSRASHCLRSPTIYVRSSGGKPKSFSGSDLLVLWRVVSWMVLLAVDGKLRRVRGRLAGSSSPHQLGVRQSEEERDGN